MKIFDILKIFKVKNPTGEPLNLNKIVDLGLISKEEMLFLLKERAIIKWETELRAEKNTKK